MAPGCVCNSLMNWAVALGLNQSVAGASAVRRGWWCEGAWSGRELCVRGGVLEAELVGVDLESPSYTINIVQVVIFKEEYWLHS